jgi:protein quaking
MLRTGSCASLVTARSSTSTTSTTSETFADVVKHQHRGAARQNTADVGGGSSNEIESPTARPQPPSSRRRPRKPFVRGGKRHFERGAPGTTDPLPTTYSQPRMSDYYGELVDLDLLLYSTRELCSLVEHERFSLSPGLLAQFQIVSHRILSSARSVANYVRRQNFVPSPQPRSIYDNLLRSRTPAKEVSTNLGAGGDYSQNFDYGFQNEDTSQLSAETIVKNVKIMIPENHPDYNFIGRILGPRGISVRQLEAATGCGILIRGRGSVKNPVREERLRERNAPGFEHLKEPLHVLISTEGNDEAECDAKLEKCKRRIEKLLKPEYDEYKRRQLAQLAMINGNYDPGRCNRRILTNTF